MNFCRRPRPLVRVILCDILAFAVLLTSFCYFHHIRILWGDQSGSIGAWNASDPAVRGETFTGNAPAFLAAGETPIVTENSYRSSQISLTLTEKTVKLIWGGNSYYVQYYVYDVYVKHLENIYSSYATSRKDIFDLVDRTADLTDGAGVPLTDGVCVAAVNDDYWGNSNHTLVALRNGKILRKSEYIESDVCVLYYDGTMKTYTPDEYDWAEIEAGKPYQIWNFGPSLLDGEGHALSQFNADSYDSHVIGNRNPRTAIGYYEPGHYCFVVVDGRSSDSDGMRMFQLADLMEELGCSVAYNLDGGGSSLAYFDGRMIRETEGADKQRALWGIVCVGEIIEVEENSEGSESGEAE